MKLVDGQVSIGKDARMNRRDFMQALAVMSSGSLVGCYSRGNLRTTSDLVDVHCHIFNASDLPAEKFLRIVFIDLYPPQGVVRQLDTTDENVVDWLIELFLWILGAHGAPSAQDEIDVLNRRSAPELRWSDPTTADKDSIQRLTEFLRRFGAPDVMPIRQRYTSERGAVILRDALYKAGSAPARAPQLFSELELSDLAEHAYFSFTDIGRYLRWFTLFKLYRYVHVDQLAAFQQQQGFRPRIFSPAMIDYSKWLGEEVTSPLADQVTVMGLIAKRSSEPAIHPYVAFDPLREVYFRNGRDKVSPLKLLQVAVKDHGFAGAKLYPPMGFKPSANSDNQGYPKYVRETIPGDIGSQLNAVLEDLYRTCTQLRAVILAHAADSNGAGPSYADRADPAFWVPVFERHPTLPICLGHFGRFGYRSAAAPSSAGFPEASWEWTFGKYITQHPGAPVYADLSYFSEILGADDNTKTRLGSYFKRFAESFDPELRHLMFGTDWIMTAIEKGYPNYTQQVVQFLRSYCRFNDDAIQRILVENAEHFLGLTSIAPKS